MSDKYACAVSDCCKPRHRRGWCATHYQRWKKYGDPLGGGTFHGSPQKFFDGAFRYEGEACVIWPFSRSTNGYAWMKREGRMQYVSRLMCELVNGSPPSPNHESAHNCGKGRSGCINPTHLRWATPVENCADRVIHGTISRGEKHPKAKMTTDKVLLLRSLVGQHTHRNLAAMFGISHTAVQSIIKRKHWAHV